MASLHFDSFCSHSLRHEALKVRVNRPIKGRNRVVTRFGAPRGVRGFAGKQALLKRLLYGEENLRLRLRQVASEVVQERFLAETSFITVENNASRRQRRRKLLGQRGVILLHPAPAPPHRQVP